MRFKAYYLCYLFGGVLSISGLAVITYTLVQLSGSAHSGRTESHIDLPAANKDIFKHDIDTQEAQSLSPEKKTVSTAITFNPNRERQILKAKESIRTTTPKPISIKESDRATCKTTTTGTEYNGKQNTTISGKQCQHWADQTPHRHKIKDWYHIRNLPEQSTTKARNYCRNPDFEPEGPWCYTNDPTVRWEYCGVECCKVANYLRYEECY